MLVGDTEANRVLDQLLNLSNEDLRNVLGVAKEYADHPSIAGKYSLSAGSRLLKQLKLGLNEIGNTSP